MVCLRAPGVIGLAFGVKISIGCLINLLRLKEQMVRTKTL